MRKDVKRMVRCAEKAGWSVRRRPGATHVQLMSPDGVTIVTVESTPSDPRSIRNTAARLRRAGVSVH